MLRNKFIKEIFTYGFAGVASRFIGIFLIPLYTRMFNPAEYGLLDLLITSSSIMVLISGLQIESGVARSYYEAEQKGTTRDLIGTSIILYVLSAVPFIAILVLGIIYGGIIGYQGIMWKHLIPILAGLLPAQFVGLALTVLRLQHNLNLFIFLSIGDILLSSILSIIAIVIFKYGVIGALWGLFISKLFWTIVSACILYGFYNIKLKLNYIKEILIYSIPTVPSTIIGWTQNFANRFILVATLSISAVGIFSLSVKIASIITIIITAFRMAWYPYALELMGKPEAPDKYAHVMDYYWIGIFMIAAFVGASSDLLVMILSTNKYSEAARFVGFLSMGLLWNGAVQILGIGIDYVRKTYLGLIGISIGTIVNMLILILTVAKWGIMAAAVSYMIGSIITSLIIYFISQRHFYIPYRLVSIYVIALISIILPFVFYLNIGISGIHNIIYGSIVKIAITCIICIIITWVILPKKDRHRILLFIST